MSDTFDTYTRAVIFNLMQGSQTFGQHSLGLYKVESLFKANLGLHLQAAATNRYTTHAHTPVRALHLSSPYIYFRYVGWGTADIVTLDEYDSNLKMKTIETMIQYGEVGLGPTVFAPQEYGHAEMKQFIFP